MEYLYIAESVSEGHPDKIADQISDNILDAILSIDKNAKVACEVLATYKKIIISGEINTNAKVDYKQIVKSTLNKIDYSNDKYINEDFPIEIIINNQSEEIFNLVDKKNSKEIGAGDQGIVVGYATNETKSFMPFQYVLSTEIVKQASILRKNGVLKYINPDSKSQVAITKEYNQKNKT